MDVRMDGPADEWTEGGVMGLEAEVRSSRTVWDWTKTGQTAPQQQPLLVVGNGMAGLPVPLCGGGEA